jgi:membrane protein implicated in regulation of membrane protease activity
MLYTLYPSSIGIRIVHILEIHSSILYCMLVFFLQGSVIIWFIIFDLLIWVAIILNTVGKKTAELIAFLFGSILFVLFMSSMVHEYKHSTSGGPVLSHKSKEFRHLNMYFQV